MTEKDKAILVEAIDLNKIAELILDKEDGCNEVEYFEDIEQDGLVGTLTLELEYHIERDFRKWTDPMNLTPPEYKLVSLEFSVSEARIWWETETETCQATIEIDQEELTKLLTYKAS